MPNNTLTLAIELPTHGQHTLIMAVRMTYDES
jgi:hypothetical protein